MLVQSLDDQHIQDIGHAFGYYDYGSETGLAAAFESPEKTAVYITGFARAMLQATVVFSVLGLVFQNALGLTGYRAAFFYFLVLGEGLGLFDLVVIDLLWWRNTRRIRFSFLPEKAPYQNPKEHIASFLRGIPLFAAAAAISAGIVTLL